jgi:hypothetical protein
MKIVDKPAAGRKMCADPDNEDSLQLTNRENYAERNMAVWIASSILNGKCRYWFQM